MFNKFFNFLRKYVTMSVYGKRAEKVINICMRRNISVWNTEPFEGGIRMCMRAKDFRTIRDVARKCGVKVKILHKHGMKYEIKKYRKRYMFFAGFAACIAIFAISSEFIWVVEINGAENCNTGSIIETLDRLGIKRGALKRNVPKGNVIKREILKDTDGIAWAWVYMEGAKARVEIYEKTIPPEVIDKNAPCDIAAACDGVIKHLIVKNGEEQVKQGDAVKAGDIIVSSKTAVYKEGYPEEYIYVHAMASAQAYTKHSETGEYKLYIENRIPTGNTASRCSPELFGKSFKLPFCSVKYKDYDLSETRYELNIPFFGFTGIAANMMKYTEVTVEKQPIEKDAALDIAKNDLEEKISKQLMPGSVLTEENIDYEQIDDETIRVTLEMNFIENIAVERTVPDENNEGEETFDKQTDRSAAGG